MMLNKETTETNRQQEILKEAMRRLVPNEDFGVVMRWFLSVVGDGNVAYNPASEKATAALDMAFSEGNRNAGALIMNKLIEADAFAFTRIKRYNNG